MKIVVQNIQRRTPDGYLIQFKTDVGSAPGLWISDDPPQLNGAYHVEISTREDLRFGYNVHAVDLTKDKISPSGGGRGVYLFGEVSRLRVNNLNVELKIGSGLSRCPYRATSAWMKGCG